MFDTQSDGKYKPTIILLLLKLSVTHKTNNFAIKTSFRFVISQTLQIKSTQD
jgi:hypothetical protein